MLGVVATNADDLSQWQMDGCAILPVVLVIRHGRLLIAVDYSPFKRANSINLKAFVLQLA